MASRPSKNLPNHLLAHRSYCSFELQNKAVFAVFSTGLKQLTLSKRSGLMTNIISPPCQITPRPNALSIHHTFGAVYYYWGYMVQDFWRTEFARAQLHQLLNLDATGGVEGKGDEDIPFCETIEHILLCRKWTCGHWLCGHWSTLATTETPVRVIKLIDSWTTHPRLIGHSWILMNTHESEQHLAQDKRMCDDHTHLCPEEFILWGGATILQA